jgi:glucuronate isomerase
VEDAASYNDYLKKLESVVNSSIDSYDELCSALEQRIDFFHEHGGRLADHGLEQLYYFDTTAHNCNTIFTKIKGGQTLANEEVAFLRLELYCSFLGNTIKGAGHSSFIGALRNNNKRLLTKGNF